MTTQVSRLPSVCLGLPQDGTWPPEGLERMADLHTFTLCGDLVEPGSGRGFTTDPEAVTCEACLAHPVMVQMTRLYAQGKTWVPLEYAQGIYDRGYEDGAAGRPPTTI